MTPDASSGNSDEGYWGDGALVDPWLHPDKPHTICVPTFCRWCEEDLVVTPNDYDLCPVCDVEAVA